VRTPAPSRTRALILAATALLLLAPAVGLARGGIPPPMFLPAKFSAGIATDQPPAILYLRTGGRGILTDGRSERFRRIDVPKGTMRRLRRLLSAAHVLPGVTVVHHDVGRRNIVVTFRQPHDERSSPPRELVGSRTRRFENVRLRAATAAQAALLRFVQSALIRRYAREH